MRIEFSDTLSSIPAHQWDALWADNYPFTQHAFLLALEKSSCISAVTGWQSFHCLAWEGQHLIGAIPLYKKMHSYGEYVFDWSWANASHQIGVSYYPKLVNAIPFTPSTGPRWGVKKEATEVLSKMLDAIFDTIKNGELSSFHCLFPNENLPEHSLIQRIDCQFHWFNENFSSFEDFLDTLTSRKRKNIRKEREKIGNQGFIVDIVEGENLTTSDWHAFYNLYRQTYLKRSGHNGYLNEAFFQMLGTVLKNQTIIVRARRKQHDVWCAAALYFKDNKTLYGRYWGAINEYDSLHFECCYYQGIEYAIRHRLQRFDPGTQGEHKIARGFTPILTQSFHYIKHRILNEAVYDFLQKEKQDVIHYCDSARTLLPFQQGHALQSPFSLIDSSGKNNDVQNK